MAEITLTGCNAAHFVMGYMACILRLQRKPSKKLCDAVRIARQVLTGGSCCGPMAVWDMEAVAQELCKLALEEAEK